MNETYRYLRKLIDCSAWYILGTCHGDDTIKTWWSVSWGSGLWAEEKAKKP